MQKSDFNLENNQINYAHCGAKTLISYWLNSGLKGHIIFLLNLLLSKFNHYFIFFVSFPKAIMYYMVNRQI